MAKYQLKIHLAKVAWRALAGLQKHLELKNK